MTDCMLVLCTCPDASSGAVISTALIEERLAACVNLQPGITSVYRWEEAIEEAGECLLIAKTSNERLEALTGRLRALHDYELPEIVAVPVTAGLPGYLSWVAEECATPRAAD